MSTYKIDETCGCGATFSLTGGFWQYIDVAVKDWRTGHKHPALIEDRPGGGE